MTDTQTQTQKSTTKGLIEIEDRGVDKIIQRIFDNESNNWSPLDKIPLVTQEIDKLKNEMKIFLEESDYDIGAVLKESNALCAESLELIGEMELCQKEIEQETMAEIIKSIENHDKIAKDFVRVNYMFNIVSEIIACDKYIKDFEDSQQVQCFSGAVQTVTELLHLLEHPTEGYDKLLIYDNIQDLATSAWETVRQDLLDQFQKLFSWKIDSHTMNSVKNVVTITIKICDSKHCIDIMKAMQFCKELQNKVALFSSFLLEEIFVPFMHQKCTVIVESDEIITISIYPKTEEKPFYETVINNSHKMLNFLKRKMNIEYASLPCLMRMVGDDIAQKFKDLITKECLMDTVPGSISEMQDYETITSKIANFQQFLVEIKFFKDDKCSILDYLHHLDDLFAEKSSQHYLETARSIMLQDLSNSMSIGVESVPENNSGDVDLTDEATEAALEVLDNTIPHSLFYFPRCMISKSAQKLLDLIYMMMEQAIQCSDVVCKRLYLTTRLVFELYDAVVPYHHENFLQSIPQYAALFHNNCMYLAHNLQTFGDKWLALMEDRDLGCPVNFLDLVQRMRDLGYKHLTLHMQLQRKQILDNIRSSDLNCIVVKDVLGDNAEQAIRQCLRQMQLLKNVWIGVLPRNVFTRLMATLINVFVDEVIHRVCTVEDISAEMASQLTDIYTIIVKKAPSLFHNPNDVEEHVKSWTKLQELILILSGSLKDIEKRWDDGTGPLAFHFRTEEIRNLIKALFQNTQIRANLLSKIK